MPMLLNSLVAIALVAVAALAEAEVPSVPADASAERGRQLILKVGCGSCHRIPGINAANGQVGPPLDKLAQRGYLAGVLPNNFANLVQWISEPQSVAPESAMPDMGITVTDARHIAAYLYTLQ